MRRRLSQVDVHRSVHPHRLKKFSLWDKYVYGLSTSLSCISLRHYTFFSVPSCSFSRRVRSPLVDAILKMRGFNLKTSGWLFQVLDRTLLHVNPWQCPFNTSQKLLNSLTRLLSTPCKSKYTCILIQFYKPLVLLVKLFSSSMHRIWVTSGLSHACVSFYSNYYMQVFSLNTTTVNITEEIHNCLIWGWISMTWRYWFL